MTLQAAEHVEATMAVPEISPGLRSLRTSAWEDLVGGLRRWPLWTRLGWLEIKRRYRRTTLGPFWAAISLLVFVFAIGGLGSGLLGRQSQEYLPYLVSGMVVWVMLSTMIIESCVVFLHGVNLLRQMRFDYSILVYALLWRNLIAFVHNLSIYLLIFVLYAPEKLGVMQLWALPGLLLILLNGAWIALLLGMFALRFRDVQPLVQSLIQITMFVTPIFWPADSLTGMRRIIYVGLNPFYHLMVIIRNPLMGLLPPLNSILAVMLITVVGWTVAYFAFSFFRKRIAYWV
jgi:homopolymeric O-antigen transport system permease protein